MATPHIATRKSSRRKIRETNLRPGPHPGLGVLVASKMMELENGWKSEVKLLSLDIVTLVLDELIHMDLHRFRLLVSFLTQFG